MFFYQLNHIRWAEIVLLPEIFSANINGNCKVHLFCFDAVFHFIYYMCCHQFAIVIRVYGRCSSFSSAQIVTPASSK